MSDSSEEDISEHLEPEHPSPGRSQANHKVTPAKDTPCTMLHKINPIPSMSNNAVQNARKRGKQIAALLTSPENIEKRKEIEERKFELEKSKSARAAKRTKTTHKPKPKKTKKVYDESSSDENDADFVSQESDDSLEDDDSAECVGCGEQYLLTSKKDDWVQCVNCEKWFHDGCSKFVNLCHTCGRVLALKKK